MSLLVQVHHFYKRWVSPLFGERCRFLPSCSDYAVEAIQEHGKGYGLWLSLKRVLKCAPYHPGGFDPVPKRMSRKSL
jgi:uncharacterized protein